MYSQLLFKSCCYIDPTKHHKCLLPCSFLLQLWMLDRHCGEYGQLTSVAAALSISSGGWLRSGTQPL